MKDIKMQNDKSDQKKEIERKQRGERRVKRGERQRDRVLREKLNNCYTTEKQNFVNLSKLITPEIYRYNFTKILMFSITSATLYDPT